MRDVAIVSSVLCIVVSGSLIHAQQNPQPADLDRGQVSRRAALDDLQHRGVRFNQQTFLESIDREDAALVRLFLSAGIDPNFNENGGVAALMIASGLHRPETSICIGSIIYYCNTVAKRNSPASLDIVVLLLKYGAQVGAKDKGEATALHKAAFAGNFEIAKALIEAGADTNASDHNGTTPLMDAALGMDDVRMAELLVKNGADVNAREVQSLSALFYAAAAGHDQILQYLISEGADVKHRGRFGTTALMKAASNGHPANLELLLNFGLDVNAQDKSGWTALMDAAFNGHEDAVALLLRWGADKTVRNRDGETASTMAAKRNFPAIVKLLR